MPAERDLPPLTWLRAFEAAARTLSFTHAAAELHVTQAAVSKHVRALESFLREPLFVRHARGIELTRAGAAYLPKVRDGIERLAIGTREVFGARQAQAVTVRCAVAFAIAWLVPRLPGFLDGHPGVAVRLLSSVWNDSGGTAGVDLDIRYGPGHAFGPGAHRLTRETITPLCAPGETGLRWPDDLVGRRLIHVLGYHEGWGIWLRAAGATRVEARAGLDVDTSLAAFALAARGAGIALGRSGLAENELGSGRLVAPFPLRVSIDEGFHVVRLAGRREPGADAFLAWLLAEAGFDPTATGAIAP